MKMRSVWKGEAVSCAKYEVVEDPVPDESQRRVHDAGRELAMLEKPPRNTMINVMENYP